MSESISIDFGPVIRAINNAGNQILQSVGHVSAQASGIHNAVNTVNSNVGIVNKNLLILTTEFQKMVKEQRMAAALQRALTEIIRVRQELEQKYGNYKVVRDNMLGVLQATDKALVTQGTISRVSEELMLATPNYWLAPLLVAVSAWIGNDPNLAERAIKEAVKRDEEKTALTMALICRRNDRTDTCFEWLQVYFSKQNAHKMKRSIVTYIDAYVSEVFGHDNNNLCGDYINKWMSEIQANDPKYKEHQVKYWQDFYATFCHDVRDKYPALAAISTNFAPIENCVTRVNASSPIKKHFRNIVDAPVNKEELIAKIDQHLLDLVSEYDDDEAPLREEEELLQAIKDFKGDEAKATALLQFKKKKYNLANEPVNLIERLSQTIISNDQENSAARKTAFMFLNEYIKEGYNNFINENVAGFPEKANVKIDNWTGSIEKLEDKVSLTKSFEAKMLENKEAELAKVTNKPVIVGGSIAGVGAVAGIIGFAVGGGGIVLGIAGLAAAVIGGVKAVKSFKKIKQTKADIENKYADKIKNGKNTLGKSVDQWCDVKSCVDNFYALPQNKAFELKEAN